MTDHTPPDKPLPNVRDWEALADPAWEASGYTSPLAEVEDMANVGRSLMERLGQSHPFLKNWHPLNDPSEIVTDLLNALDEAALTSPSPEPGGGIIEKVARAIFEAGEAFDARELAEPAESWDDIPAQWRRKPTEQARAALSIPRTDIEGDGWQSIEMIDKAKASQMFGASQWVLVATDDGRITEAEPYFPDEKGWWFWICARGSNSYQKGQDKGFLTTAVTHWRPHPAPPGEHRAQVSLGGEGEGS